MYVIYRLLLLGCAVKKTFERNKDAFRSKGPRLRHVRPKGFVKKAIKGELLPEETGTRRETLYSKTETKSRFGAQMFRCSSESGVKLGKPLERSQMIRIGLVESYDGRRS